MNCPKCGFVQPDGLPDCQRCQIIFAKWQTRQSQAAETMTLQETGAVPVSGARAVPPPLPLPRNVPPPPPPMNAAPPPPPNDFLPQHTYIPVSRHIIEDEPQGRNVMALLGLLAAGVLLAGAAWALFSPAKGLPEVEGSWRAPDNAFAILPPAEWKTTAPDNVQALTRNGAGLSGEAKQLAASAREVVSFIRRSASGTDVDNISVIVLAQQLPHLSKADKADAEQGFIESTSRKFPGIDVKLDDSAFLKIDKLQALRLSSHATGTNRMTRMSVSVYLKQFIVPGDGRTYLIQCISMSADNPVCDDVVGSFRVLKRPTLLGGSGFLSGAVKGGLIGGAIGLFVGLLKWLLGGS